MAKSVSSDGAYRAPKREVYWTGDIGQSSNGRFRYDDFDQRIVDQFIDGRTRRGPWAIMTPESFAAHGSGKLGTGYGQRFQKQADGRWLKVEG